MRVLASSPKRSVLPRDYIALLGDSHAQGDGDWLRSISPWSNGPFGSQHLLHGMTGRDVLSFGRGGYGSLGGIAGAPVAVYQFLRKTLIYRLSRPKDVMVYLYEGNDLNNNLRNLEALKPAYDAGRIHDTAYFRDFIERRIIPDVRHFLNAESTPWYGQLFCLKFMRELYSNLGREEEAAIRPTVQDQQPYVEEAENGRRINRIRMNGQETGLPDHLQSPALELTEPEIALAIYVFAQSLDYVAEFFQPRKVFVVYIPSPISAYEWKSDKVSIQSYQGRGDLYDTAFAMRRHDQIVQRIRSLTEERGFVFIDPTPALREVAKTERIHGPKDWKHFNRKGYAKLAETIAPHVSTGARGQASP